MPGRHLLLVTLASVLVYTLAPFDVSWSLADVARRARDVLEVSDSDGVLDLAGHFAAFFSLGALLAGVYHRVFESRGLGPFLLPSFAFCAGLEAMQLPMESRHARAVDLVCNVAGIWLGAASVVRTSLGPAVHRLWGERGRVYGPRVRTLILLAGSVAWLSAAWLPIPGLMKLGWDPGFPLLFGSELDREGPWLGAIKGLGIYGRTLSRQEMEDSTRRTAAGARGEVRWAPQLLLGYDFGTRRTPLVEPQGSLKSEDLAVEIPGACEWAEKGGGLLLRKPSLLVSQGRASALTEAILASGAFSVETWIHPALRGQGEGEPSRIVSQSQGIWWRNFTLAQESADVVFRVRNGVNGANGLRYALRVKDAMQDSMQHFVAVYDHGVSALFRDGRLLKPVVDLREPTLYLGLGSGVAGQIAAGLLLTVTLALPAYAVLNCLGAGRLRHVIAVALSFLVGSVPYAASCLVVGGPWRADLVLGVGVVLLLAYPLCWWYVRPRAAVVEASAGALA